MVDINKLITSLEDINEVMTKISLDIKQLEKILINSNFPIKINLFCFVDENGKDIYIAWDKEEESEHWGLLATKVWEDDSGINSAYKRMDNLKVVPKILLYPYLPQFIEKIEEKAQELKRILSRNQLIKQ